MTIGGGCSPMVAYKNSTQHAFRIVMLTLRSELAKFWLQLNDTHFRKFAALLCLQYGPAKAGFRLNSGTTNFRKGVCSTEL